MAKVVLKSRVDKEIVANVEEKVVLWAYFCGN